jgi:hypothetical protein
MGALGEPTADNTAADRMTDDTREVMLEGLRQALSAKVANIWTNVTLAGEPNPERRFKEGVTKAAVFYRQAVKAIKEMEM